MQLVDIWPANAKPALCPRTMTLFVGTTEIIRTAVDADEKDYIGDSVKVMINPNIAQVTTYTVKIKYDDEATPVDHDIEITVQCIATSQSFTITMTNSTAVQKYEIFGTVTGVPFYIQTITASQTKSCDLLNLKMSDVSTAVNLPTNFSPNTITDFTSPPFELTNTDVSDVAKHDFYLHAEFTGGSTLLDLSGVDQFSLDVTVGCGGTPILTQTDTTAPKYHLMKNNGTFKFTLNQTYIDNIASDTWNCPLETFKLYDNAGTNEITTGGVTLNV